MISDHVFEDSMFIGVVEHYRTKTVTKLYNSKDEFTNDDWCHLIETPPMDENDAFEEAVNSYFQ